MKSNIKDMKEKDIIDWLKILNRREAEIAQETEEIRKDRALILNEMELQSSNIELTRYQVADILEYNYYYLSRLDIPFEKAKIYYLDLLEWLNQYQPGRIKRVEKNFKAFLKEQTTS